MKPLFKTILIVIGIYNQNLFAQGPPVCGLFYSYDGSGNRIQRKYVANCNHYEMDTIPSTQNSDGSQISVPNQDLTESLYPNPTSGNFTVVFSNSVTDAQITVNDNVGRQLYSIVVSGLTVPLNISHFAQGIYFININANGSIFNNTIVKN